MSSIPEQALDYHRSIVVADGIHWVGFYDAPLGLHCNPYLITDGGESVLIDAGSRPDFSSVMLKILDVIEPVSISAIVLQHYDPDLCSSVPIMEEMIGNPDLRIISHRENNPFIKHYGVTSPIVCFETLGSSFRFASGRELRFYCTPFAHSAGSFMTYDVNTGVLFTGDLFGSYSSKWELFLRLERQCGTCAGLGECTGTWPKCPMPELVDFHRRVMTSGKALRYAMQQVRRIAPRIIAPQHGSVIFREEDVRVVTNILYDLDQVGIDGYEVPE